MTENPHCVTYNNWARDYADSFQLGVSGAAVLKLKELKFSRWQLWSGRSLDPAGMVGRLILLYCRAVEDELSGRWQRADFYWEESLRTLKHIDERVGAWDLLNNQFGCSAVSGSVSGDSLRLRVIDELFVDTWFALFNGYIEPSNILSPNRGIAHALRLIKILPVSDINDSERQVTTESLTDYQIDQFCLNREWPKAIKVCSDTLSQSPKSIKYQDRFVNLVIESTLAEIDATKKIEANIYQAYLLGVSIANLEDFLKGHPFNPAVYESLGLMNFLRAVKLANGAQWADSLLSIEKALAYSPDDPEIADMRKQLYSHVQELQDQIRAVDTEMAASFDSRLNERREYLKHQARQVPKLARTFLESGRSAEIPAAQRVARAVRALQNAGFNGAAEDIAVYAVALCEALERRQTKPASDDSSFSSMIEEFESAPGFDSRIRESLEENLHRYFVSDNPIEESLPHKDPAESAVLKPIVPSEVKSREPAAMWLFNGDIPGLKIVAAFALVTLLISIVLAVWDLYQRENRNQAYTALVDARNEGRHYAVLSASLEYNSSAGLWADGRKQQVDKLVSNSLYEEFTDSIQTDSSERVMDAAEAFLAESATEKDSRRIHVIDEYSRAFISWFTGTTGSIEEPSVRQRIDVFRRLISAEQPSGERL